jgi:hypothetical protein
MRSARGLDHVPATYRQRGVSVPFTTPLLFGARVRSAPENGPEILLPDLSGAAAICVVPVSSVPKAFRPTVHDTMLLERIAALPRIDPGSIRGAAWDVARAGLAGPRARAAARATDSTDLAQRTLARTLLTDRLLETLCPNTPAPPPADRLAAVLRRLNLPADDGIAGLARDLLGLADSFAPLGIDANDSAARVPRLIARLGHTRATMHIALRADPDDEVTGLGCLLARSMATTHDLAAAQLAATRCLMSDPLLLLRYWITARPHIQARISRTEWIMDGWETIALLWTAARDHVARRLSILEMARLVPAFPQEAIEWSRIAMPDSPLTQPDLAPRCRVFSFDDSWRSGGAAVAMIGRNETLRAQSL